MNNIQSLLASADFAQARLLGSLESIAKLPDPRAALAFRPAAGRAHSAWQFLHVAATLNKYVNFIKNVAPSDPDLVANYGGGSTPSDNSIPAPDEIRTILERDYAVFRAYIAAQTSTSLEQKVTTPGNHERTISEAIILLTWHGSHHQGQIHITLNIFKAANGLK